MSIQLCLKKYAGAGWCFCAGLHAKWSCLGWWLWTPAETKWPPFRRQHFQMHFLERKCMNFAKISLKFVPGVPINNIPALVRIMARRRPGDKSLSEPMMVSSPTHICVTRPQWVNTFRREENDWHLQAIFSIAYSSKKIFRYFLMKISMKFVSWVRLDRHWFRSIGIGSGWTLSAVDEWVMVEWPAPVMETAPCDECVWDYGVPGSKMVSNTWRASVIIGIYPVSSVCLFIPLL